MRQRVCDMTALHQIVHNTIPFRVIRMRDPRMRYNVDDVTCLLSHRQVYPK